MAMVYGVYKEQEYEILFENSNFLSVSLIDINFFLSVWSVRINDFEVVSCINLVAPS